MLKTQLTVFRSRLVLSVFCMLCCFRRYSRERLHQLKLHWWLPQTERLHCHTRRAAGDLRRFLAYDLGAAECKYCHDDQTGGKIQGTICCDITTHLLIRLAYTVVCSHPTWQINHKSVRRACGRSLFASVLLFHNEIDECLNE